MAKQSSQQFLLHYREYFDKIFNYLYYRAGRDRAIAEDLTQEVFLKALENFEQFDASFSSFSSWIYAIARNHLIDFYRTRKVAVALEDVENFLHHPGSITEQLSLKQDMAVILRKIDALPPAYQEIITLKYVNELDHDEIADILKKEPGTVRVLLHRALGALKQLMSS